MKYVIATIMILTLVACNNSTKVENIPIPQAVTAEAPDHAEGQVWTDKDPVMTYGQKVLMTGGFYKGCVGRIVGFGHKNGYITFDVDLDKKCDGKQIYTFGTELIEKVK